MYRHPPLPTSFLREYVLMTYLRILEPVQLLLQIPTSHSSGISPSKKLKGQLHCFPFNGGSIKGTDAVKVVKYLIGQFIRHIPAGR